MDFWSVLGPNFDPKQYWFSIVFTFVVWKIDLLSWYRFLMPFWLQLGSVLVLKIYQNPSKKRSRKPSKFLTLREPAEANSRLETRGSRLEAQRKEFENATMMAPSWIPNWDQTCSKIQYPFYGTKVCQKTAKSLALRVILAAHAVPVLLRNGWPEKQPEGTKIKRKWSRRPPKIEPKWSPRPPKSSQNGVQMGSGRGKIRKNADGNKKTGGVAQGPPIFPDNVAQMAPTWPPKRSQNGSKIVAKIDQNFDGFRDRFLERFWWVFGAKMEASWHQNRIENWYELRIRVFQKTTGKQGKSMIFWFPGVEVGSQNRSKINQKMVSKIW